MTTRWGLLTRLHPAGVCLFSRNLTSREQTASLTDAIRTAFDGGLPPFIAVDQEGGNVVRLKDGNVVLPGNMLLGATRDPELAWQAGYQQGLDLSAAGLQHELRAGAGRKLQSAESGDRGARVLG